MITRAVGLDVQLDYMRGLFMDDFTYEEINKLKLSCGFLDNKLLLRTLAVGKILIFQRKDGGTLNHYVNKNIDFVTICHFDVVDSVLSYISWITSDGSLWCTKDIELFRESYNTYLPQYFKVLTTADNIRNF
jgi:hypothetical protein